jgi:hypothetical protein
MVVQIDGTIGSAVAGRMRCFTQSAVNTPEAFFGGGRPANADFFAQWQEVPDTAFLSHVGEDVPYEPTLLEGAKAVQLADLAYHSVAEGRWIPVPELRL